MSNSAGDTPFPDDDDALLAELRSIAAIMDPPPQEYLDYAVEALSFSRLDEELGLLVELAKESMGPVRSLAATDGPIEFSFSDLLLSLYYDDRTVSGSILPAASGAVRVMTQMSADYGAIEADGTFVVDRTGGGPFRLAVVLGDRSYATDWIP